MRLLYEIGVEELPAGEIAAAREALASHFVARAADARLPHGAMQTYATPRRLALVVDDVAATANTVEETVMGPAARAAFDAEGRPTKAAEGFARGQGVDPAALFRVETPKGEYVAARVVRGGGAARDIVRAILDDAPAAIPWKRSMRWAWSEVTFARPVHWLVALLDSDVLPVRFGDIEAGRITFGHRFLAPGAIELRSASEWLDALRAADVIADVDERRAAVRDGVARLAEAEGLRALVDETLVDEVANLVELPVPLLGHFDEGLLEVPREVLITTMATHQRYFAAERPDGTLANVFVFVSNMRVPRPEVVVAGNLRVLRARLEDGRFFFREDRKKSLEDRLSSLADVVFIDKLGSVLDRTHRLSRLVSSLAARLYPGRDDVAAHASRAALLCKSDLVSGMVFQFPELQGTMGRYYALSDGEKSEVAVAIEEHYRPRGASDDPPASAAGVVLAIADKLDALAGCFALGLVPSGSADPYALRRAALGVLRTLIAHNLAVPVRELAALGAEALPAGLRDVDAVAAEVTEFLTGRLRALLGADGPGDVVDAVAAVAVDDLPSASARVAALAGIRGEPDFEPLAVAFKRVVNILRKATDEEPGLAEILAANDLAALVEPAERALADALAAAEPVVSAALAERRFRDVAARLVALKPAIDGFFDAVLVNAPERELRLARLALLQRVRGLFVSFADLSRIQVAG